MPHSNESQIGDFRLPASTGQTLSLESFQGKVPMVFVFLDRESPRDRELLESLNSHLRDFGSERSQVLVILRITARQARELADERGMAIPILADASGAMARDFDADDGRSTRPVAIVADKDGRVVRRFDPISAEDDASEVTSALFYAVRALGSGALEAPGE